MKKWIEQFNDNLIGRYKPVSEEPHILLAYYVGVLCFYLSAQYPILFIILKLPLSAMCTIPVVLGFYVSLILNKKGFNLTARLLIIFTNMICMIFFACLLGKSSGAHLILFGVSVVPSLIFQFHERRTLIISTLIPLISFLMLELTNYQLIPISEYISPEITKITYISGGITSFIFIFFQIILFRRINQFYQVKIEDQNQQLNISLNESKKMSQKIQVLKEAMEADLEKGKKLQNSALPQQAPQLENVIITHAFEPAKTLSGDYFDYFPDMSTAIIIPKAKKNDDEYDDDDEEDTVIVKQVGIVVADVVGKGVAASLEMFSVKTVFKLLHDHWFEPQALVTRMNQISTDSHLFSKYVPLLYVTISQIDPHRYQLKYVNAGHEPSVVIKKNGDVIILDQGGAPVGMDGDEVYIENEIILEAGDTAFMITDGCTDVKSPTGEVIGHEELIPILIEASKQKNVDIAKYVRNRLRDFQGNAAQADDMTIVVIQIK